MTEPSLLPTGAHAALRSAFESLRADLIHADGPRISTMRSYRFALLQYDPALEHELREETQHLSRDLVAAGWFVLPISLQKLLLDRVRKLGPRFLASVTAMEKAKSLRSPDQGLDYLKTKLEPLIEGSGGADRGLAGDIATAIGRYAGAYPERVERTLALIGRVGALYPFFRVSALLRHLDGHTQSVPVVILYPGLRDPATPNALSFMGVMPADSDYRPRIYP